MMAKPFLGSIIFGGILVSAFFPIHDFLVRKWGLSRKISSLVTSSIIFILVILPLAYMTIQISQEMIGFYQYVREGLTQEVVKNFFYGDGKFAHFFQQIIEMFGLSPQKIEKSFLNIVEYVSSYSIKIVNIWLGNILQLSFKFAVMLVVVYGLLLWGDDLRRYLFRLSPLPEDQERLILMRFNQMNKATLIGNGVGGLIQGGLAGIAFAFAGFQSIFMWSVIMMILAFIPLVGISIIYIPACIYLVITGHMGVAISLFIFCSLVAFLTENWFKPRFMGDQVKVNSILVLLFILGGMAAWGMVGIFYGPVICVLLLTMIDIYHDRYAQDLFITKGMEP